MKLAILKTMLLGLMLSMVSQTAMAGKFSAESMGRTFMVSKIDTKKKIIYLHDKQISYNDATKVYDASGKQVSVDNLAKNYPMSFFFDASKRYLNQPVATAIRIKTSMPLVN